MMWQAAVNMIKANPIFGLGPGNHKEKQTYYDELSKNKNHRFQHPAEVGVHNIYLQTWVDFGFIGIIGYLFWWLVLLFEILKTLKIKSQDFIGLNSLLTGILGGLVGIMTAGLPALDDVVAIGIQLAGTGAPLGIQGTAVGLDVAADGMRSHSQLTGYFPVAEAIGNEA